MSVHQYTMGEGIRIIWAVVASLPVALGIATENCYMGIAIAGLGLCFLFLVKFEIIFPLLLVVRSSLDIFTDVGFYIGPLNFNIPSSVSIFIDVMGLLYLGMIYIRGEISLLDNIAKVYLIWLLSLIFWIFWAYHNLGEEGLIGVREWFRLFSLLVIYLLSLQLVSIKGYEYLINCMMLSLVIPLSVGYYQILFQHLVLTGGYRRIYGTLAHPNVLALYLVLFVAITLWKLKFSRMKLQWIGVGLILLLALLNTFSFNGIVMLTVLLTILIIKELKIRSRIIIFIILLFFLFSFSHTDTGKKRIEEIRTMPTIIETIEGEVVTNSFTWRLVNWKLLFKQWLKRPILGYGLATHGLVNPWHGCVAHNDYLRFLVELGLLGFGFYLWFIAKIGVLLKRQYADVHLPEQKYFVLIMGAVYAAWMIGSSAGNFITATTFQFYFWALMACGMKEPNDEKN